MFGWGRQKRERPAEPLTGPAPLADGPGRGLEGQQASWGSSSKRQRSGASNGTTAAAPPQPPPPPAECEVRPAAAARHLVGGTQQAGSGAVV